MLPSVVWGTGAGEASLAAGALTAVRSVCGSPGSSLGDGAGGCTGAGGWVGGRLASARAASASRLVSPSVVWGRRRRLAVGGAGLDGREIGLRQSRIVAGRWRGRLYGGRRLGRRAVGLRAGGLSLATGVTVGGLGDRRRASPSAARALTAVRSVCGSPGSSPGDGAGGCTGAGGSVGGRLASARAASASRLVSPSVVWGTGAARRHGRRGP